MLNHVSIGVRDIARTKRFYDAAALKPLGIEPIVEHDSVTGFGEDRKPYFFINQRGEPTETAHLAFASADHAGVDAFHAAALAAGGRDNGAPGPRPYHENYYGAFVLDPDGNNIEAVCT